MKFIRVSCFALVALCAAVGCQPAQPTSTASTSSHEHEDARAFWKWFEDKRVEHPPE